MDHGAFSREGGGVTRRAALLGTLAVFGTAALAGCTPAASAGGPVPLKFWHLLSGGDGVNMAELIAKVNAGTEEFVASQTVLAWGPPYYTKLAMASAGGRGPEVAIMHASRLPGYAPGGLLDPWDIDLLAEFGVSEDNFPERIWEKGFSEGELFSIALDAHPFILMYNTDIAEQAGVLDADGRLREITSPEEFLEVASLMQQVTGEHGVSYGYLGDGAQMWRLFWTLYKEQGAEMELEPGRAAVVDEAAAVTALEFMQRMLDDTIATTRADYPSAIAEFANGQTGMFLTGVWELPTMQRAELPFDAMPIPTMFGTPAAHADSHAFVLPHQEVPDEAKRRETYRFVSEVLKESFDWAKAGHIPAYLPVTESPEYAKLQPQANYAAAAEIINYDPAAWFTGSGSDFQTYFAESIQGVLLSGDDAATGFRDFVDRLNTLLSKPTPV